MKLTGYLDEETLYVSLLNETNPIDLKAIIFAAIVIGADGRHHGRRDGHHLRPVRD